MSDGWLLSEGGRAAPYVARVAGVGSHLPATTLTTAELMASTRHRTRVDLERLTGIHERRVSDGDEDSLSLATAAARDCLAGASVDAADVDVVLNCSITKYRDGLVQWLEPTTALAVARTIGATRATAFDVSNACAGMLTGVLVLDNWIRQGQVRRGLVVSGEYISQIGRNAARHVRSIVSPELASLTLGDAGAAVLLDRARADQPGIALAAFTTIADHSRLCLAYPARHEAGARMFTRSRAIHKAAIAGTAVVLQEALDSLGLEVGDVDHVIPHQTSARAIRRGAEVLRQSLGSDAPSVVVTVDHYGNTASTTHFVALAAELRAGRVRAGERVALLAQASGLELGVVLLTVDDELVEACRGHDD